MYGPPDPRNHIDSKQPSWQGILTSYAVVAAVLFSLWAVSHPVAGATALAAAVGLRLGARRAVGLARCLRVCREFTIDLGGRVRITVTKTSIDGAS